MRALPALAWTLAVAVACLLPGAYVPDVPFSLTDKLVHVALFAVWGVLWLRAAPGRRAGVVLWGLLFAVAVEVAQETLPVNRSGDGLDVAADALGLALAAWLDVWRARRAGA